MACLANQSFLPYKYFIYATLGSARNNTHKSLLKYADDDVLCSIVHTPVILFYSFIIALNWQQQGNHTHKKKLTLKMQIAVCCIIKNSYDKIPIFYVLSHFFVSRYSYVVFCILLDTVFHTTHRHVKYIGI